MPRGQVASKSPVRTIVFSLIPTGILIATFFLGFIGEPENSRWLNASPLWQEGDPFAFMGDKELSSPVLIFRGLPHFDDGKYRHNSLGLRDDEIVIPKPSGVVRIVNLGDSSTYGLALPERSRTYSDQLERLLECPPTTSGCTRFDVVNAGTIGYSSLQVLQYLRYYGARLQPDIVTVYVGNNDWAPSGAKDAERISATASPMYQWLNNNFFYLLGQKAFLRFRQSALEARRAEFDAALRGFTNDQNEAFLSKSWYYRSLARVTPDEYENNLREIVRVGEALGARVILLKPAANLPWPYLKADAPITRVLDAMDPRTEFHVDAVSAQNPSSTQAHEQYWSPVFHTDDYLHSVFHLGERPKCAQSFLGHPYLCLLTPRDILGHIDPKAVAALTDDQIVEALRDRLQLTAPDPCEVARRSHNWSVVLIAAGRFDEANSALDVMAAEFSSKRCRSLKDQGKGQYTRGVLQLLQGDHESARRTLWEARATLPYAFSPDYAERFDRVVAGGSVEAIDVFRLFEDADRQMWGSVFIHDWVHPDPRGNAIIAQAIRDRVAAASAH